MAGPDPRIGTVLHERYKILDRLGGGSMATVYRGERLGLRRPVAIKFLHESFTADDDGRRRFEVEARAMSRLGHPNCVAVTDFGVDQGRPYLVMDYVTGLSLREVMRLQGGRLPVRRAVDLVCQVLAGLTHAHAEGIFHRDIKPDNILIADVKGHGEQARIADFGLAKLRDDVTVTTGIALGTPSYMSPEQTMGESVDERSDIYSTGIILYELIVGWKPFQASDAFKLMRMHRETLPPPMATNAPDLQLSPKLEAVVQTALAKAREDRFQTADEFLEALARVPEALPEGSARRKWWRFWGQ
jgi:serine/threonine-protein kinase